MLFWNKFTFGLCSLQPSFPSESATPYSDFTLIGIITDSFSVCFMAKHYIESISMVLFKYIFKNVINRECKYYRRKEDNNVFAHPWFSFVLQEIDCSYNE